MIVDTREVRNVSQYARMLEFVCTVMQLCGGFEPDVLLQPQVTTSELPRGQGIARAGHYFAYRRPTQIAIAEIELITELQSQ